MCFTLFAVDHFFKCPARNVMLERRGTVYTLHCGNPGMQKSEKFISLNKAVNVRVTMYLVQAWLVMEGNVIKVKNFQKQI